jgi:hypothetical protein
MQAASGYGTTLRPRRLRGARVLSLQAALRMLALAAALAAAQTFLAWHGADFAAHADDHAESCQICLHFGGLDSAALHSAAASVAGAPSPAGPILVSNPALTPAPTAFRARAPPVPPFRDHLTH